MFANGSEYQEFLAHNCEECPFYVYFDDVTDENPVCFIEEQISLSSMTDKIAFPYSWLDETGTMARYSCRRKNNQEEKV